MTSNKIDYFNDLLSQISEPIYLTDKTDEINEEIKYNHWQLTFPIWIASQMTATDFLEFIQKVKDGYKKQLSDSKIEIDLIFYMWFDEMAGQLRFNFINSNHDKLPFGCKLKYTQEPEEIINQFLNSKYLDGIPLNELETIVTQEETEGVEKGLKKDFVLSVYQEKITK